MRTVAEPLDDHEGPSWERPKREIQGMANGLALALLIWLVLIAFWWWLR